MAFKASDLEAKLREQLPVMIGLAGDGEPASASSTRPCETACLKSRPGLLDLSDEVLVLIFRRLDPFSLLRAGSTCRALLRVCSCSSLWRPLFQVSFGVSFTAAVNSISLKDAFRLLYMWRVLYSSLHCNAHLQKKLFSETPKYWVQWLVLEEKVPLPPVKLPDYEMENIWGLKLDCLEGRHREDAEEGETDGILKFEWKELYDRAIKHHGSFANVVQHVLEQQIKNDHSELEELYREYRRFRFLWHLTYWLFKQPKPVDRDLRNTFLQWKRYKRRKVASWGKAQCDVDYLAHLHHVTRDYIEGQLAKGDENVVSGKLGVLDNHPGFSLLSPIPFGKGYRKIKVYTDTLDGVYMVLNKEMAVSGVNHYQFCQVAKVQMARVCKLEETAMNYVNWRMIDSTYYYKLFMLTGCDHLLIYLKAFLHRKRVVNDWILQDENAWARQKLPEKLYRLLQFETKISKGSLHGDHPFARLSRAIWIYLLYGEQLLMEDVKELVFQYAQDAL
nr:PREDICTED: uncharacterized protein LOC102698264 [Lepisosteus oculatus]